MTSAITGVGYGPVQDYASAPPRVPPGMEAAAKTLGISGDDLRTALKSGATLADLAAQKGVSKDDLVAAIAKDLKANAPANAPAGIDFTSMATQIVDRSPGSGPPPGPPPQAGDSGNSKLSELSSLLGMKETDLLSALESGTSLSDLLASSGVSARSLLNGLGQTQGIAIDTTA